MKIVKFKSTFNICTLLLFLILLDASFAQNNWTTHTRGKLWETLYNWGFIGDPGAWDYTEITGIGFFPGFPGYTFPTDEIAANGAITDANFHNFRTGPWIIVKDADDLVPPDYSPVKKDYLLYHSSLATGDEGVVPSLIPSFTKTKNYDGSPDFNPLLPEEMNYVEFATATGITVKQRSMSWSFPGYDDFIIYDYVFKNTGDMAIPAIKQILHHEQTLNEVWIVFHSGIQVSTKGVINFHYEPGTFTESAVPAGAFGWHPKNGYTDYYVLKNYTPGANTPDGKGLLYYSRDFNGGRNPVPWDSYKQKTNWRDLLKKKPEWLPELQDPAAFGFTFLYRTPPKGAISNDPFDADPTHFNIYSDEGQKFQNKNVDFEGFGLNVFSKKQIYEFAQDDNLAPNNGRNYNWYTSSFGPYTLAPGDSVRIIIAEIAGELDLKEIIKGDPDHWLKSYDEAGWETDSTSADMNKNYEALRNAIKWGLGANVNGINLAADVPDSPPSPNVLGASISKGSDTAIVAIQWDKSAEDAQITDGSGEIFFNGSSDLSGYRIYRSIDKRGAWDLVDDIPRANFSDYWNTDKQQYEYLDKNLQFGNEFYYYVQAYYSNPKEWTSANGTVVPNLPELVSADYNRTPLISARPGPVSLNNGWDVFVAPNPFIQGDATHSFGDPNPMKIEFRNLPKKAIINIYSISGDLIKTLRHGPDSNGNLYGSIDWDQRSDSGLLVAPGMYIYVVQSETEGSVGSKFTGKLMIIR